MAVRSEFTALALTVGLGIGVAYAVHEVNDLNREADQVQVCLDASPDSQAAITDFCTNVPHSEAEVATLRDSADTAGTLGWTAFFGTLCAGGETYRQMRSPAKTNA